VHALPGRSFALLFDFLPNYTRPRNSNPGKKIGGGLLIDPFVDFDFVDPAQFPDLVLDLFGIHSGLFSSVESHPLVIVQFTCSYPYSSGWVAVAFEYADLKEPVCRSEGFCLNSNINGSSRLPPILILKLRNAFGHSRDIAAETVANRAKNAEGDIPVPALHAPQIAPV